MPPQGGAFEVPVHAGKVCILSFGEKLSSKALTGSGDYEVKSCSPASCERGLAALEAAAGGSVCIWRHRQLTKREAERQRAIVFMI